MKRNVVITDLLGVAVEPTYFDLKNTRPDPAAIVKMIRSAGGNTIRVGMFSHQGYAYYPSKIAPEAPGLAGRDLLAEFGEACRLLDVRFAVYLNSKWVLDLYRQHPDWAVKIKGKVFSFRGVDPASSLVIYAMCPCSPFHDYFTGIIREVVGRSSPDCVYIDNFAVIPFCTCKFCREKFGVPIPGRKSWRSTERQRYLAWVVEESRRLAAGMVAAARSGNPKMPVVFNRGQFWTLSDTFSPEDNRVYAHEIAEMVHAEAAVRFYGESFRHINEQCAFGRSIGLPLWTWVEYGDYPFSYIPSSPEEAKIKAATILANGGRPMVWNLPCAPDAPGSGLSGIAVVYALAGKHPECFNGVSFNSCLGIVHSSRSIRAYVRGEQARLDEYRKEFFGCQALALRCHLPYDFLLDEDFTSARMRKYTAIILPEVICLDASQCRALETYVRCGGNLFATGAVSLYDELGRRMKDFRLGKLLGARFVRDLGLQTRGYCAGYARFSGDHPIAAGFSDRLFPIAGNYLGVDSPAGIARLLKPCRYFCDYPQPETEYPAVIAGSFGKGKVLYVPGRFFSAYAERGFLEYKEFFARTMDWFTGGEPPVATDLPESVEVTLARTPTGKTVVHLVNKTFEENRPVAEIIPVSGRYLKLKGLQYTRAVDITTGKAVGLRREPPYLRLSLPNLSGYTVLVLS